MAAAVSWQERVLAIAGPRFCTSPTRFAELKLLLMSKTTKLSPAKVHEEAEQILQGLPCFYLDLLFDIDKGTGFELRETNPWRLRRDPLSVHSILYSEREISDFVVKNQAAAHSKCLEDGIKDEIFVFQTALKSYRDYIILANRKSIKTKPRFNLNFAPSLDSIENFGFSALQRITMINKRDVDWEFLPLGSSELTKPALINRVDMMPRYVTSIPNRLDENVTENDTHLTFVPSVAGNDHLRTIVDKVVDLPWNLSAFQNCDADLLEQVSFVIVEQFGPSDPVIYCLSQTFKIPPFLVRRACEDHAIMFTPRYSNHDLPLKLRLTRDPVQQIDSFRYLFCSRCCVFDCRLHGNARPPKHERVSFGGEVAITKSNNMWDEQDAVDVLHHHASRLFPKDENKAKLLLRVFQGEAPTLFPLRKSDGIESSNNPLGEGHPRHIRIPGWREPCSHAGPCSSSTNCSCFTSRRYCEKDCGCDFASCPNRFPGCECDSTSSDGCHSKVECHCRRYGRECVEGLCRCQGCLNRYMSLHAKGPKLAIGASTVHLGGLGTFAREDIRKGTFVGEYAGEILSNKEADKRGFIYDEIVHVTFLFQLCADRVVDCLRHGTKTKWMNFAPNPKRADGDQTSSSSSSSDEEEDAEEEHLRKKKKKRLKLGLDEVADKDEFSKKRKNGKAKSKRSNTNGTRQSTQSMRPVSISTNRSNNQITANCASSILFVDGDPRICLFAKQEIAKGEELCFDYGKFKKDQHFSAS